MRAWEIEPGILQPPVIDIGSGKGPLKCQYPVRTWDIIDGDGDATYLRGIADSSYRTVYSHHLLEHLRDPVMALTNWWRVLGWGGYLIVTVPHRDYYEKSRELPSRFNSDHKTMWLPDKSDPPNTFSLLEVFQRAVPEGELMSLRTITDGYVPLLPEQQSPDGFHLELVAFKH